MGVNMRADMSMNVGLQSTMNDRHEGYDGHDRSKRMQPVSRHVATASLSRAAGVAVTLLLSSCTHTLTFSDSAPIVVTGTPPTPPPIDTEPPAPPKPPPKVEVQRDKIVIHEKIQFETDKATIKPESSALLDEITQVITDNPQIRRLSIEGHTDSTGSNAHNQALSEQRAAAVQDYLIAHGIAGDRLSSRGWGENRPLEDNTTPEGREANRRVEFVILEQDAQGSGAEAEEPAAPAEGDAP